MLGHVGTRKKLFGDGPEAVNWRPEKRVKRFRVSLLTAECSTDKLPGNRLTRSFHSLQETDPRHDLSDHMKCSKG